MILRPGHHTSGILAELNNRRVCRQTRRSNCLGYTSRSCIICVSSILLALSRRKARVFVGQKTTTLNQSTQQSELRCGAAKLNVSANITLPVTLLRFTRTRLRYSLIGRTSKSGHQGVLVWAQNKMTRPQPAGQVDMFRVSEANNQLKRCPRRNLPNLLPEVGRSVSSSVISLDDSDSR